MRKLSKILILGLLVTVTLIGCNSVEKSDGEFNLEQFKNELNSKNYDFEIIKNSSKDNTFGNKEDYFMMIDSDNTINVYIYEDNMQMEEYSEYIADDGCSYNKKGDEIVISWVNVPHFYKKGNMIINYVGTDKNILEDLNDIFGEQFAGENS